VSRRIFGILSIAFVAIGVALTAVLGWQYGVENMIAANHSKEVAASLTQQWQTSPPAPVEPDTVPVLTDTPKKYSVFARLFIPAFGTDWVRPIAEGTSVEHVLNPIGVGHYEGTALPGQVGNMAIAAHRTTHGASFDKLDTLRPGDQIIVETADGWYTYEFVSEKTVLPTDTSVIAPVPNHPEMVPVERWLTMTTCTPRHQASHRLIAFAKYVTFTPHSEGPPPAIAGLVNTLSQK
jgi:sortase A